MLTNLRVCVVECDVTIRRELANLLTFAGMTVAEDGDEADFALLGSDSGSGSRHWERLPLVALDGRADSARATQHRLPFPFQMAELNGALQRVSAEHSASFGRSHHADLPGSGDCSFPELIGISAPMMDVREMMQRVVNSEATVLITGESGTGKEVVARCLHVHSNRRAGPFVPVNCGAIPSELLESELFGHTKGAFTGAITDRVGRFELASGGTLFLDEIGDLPLHMQVKLLRAIQERCFERVGGSQTIRADVRIIAATHNDLESLMAKGQFRDDLFYRLNVFPIDLPPLRDRVEDIPLLIDGHMRKTRAGRRNDIRLSTAAMASLQAHEWSGNVRELINLVERLCILFPFGVVDRHDLPRKFQHDVSAAHGRTEARHTDLRGPESTRNTLAVDDAHPASLKPSATTSIGNEPVRANWLDPDALPMLPVNGIDLRDFMTRLERNLIQQALDDTNSVVAHAADRLHIRRTTLVEKMRKYGLGRADALEPVSGIDTGGLS